VEDVALIHSIKGALEDLLTDDVLELPIERMQHLLALVGRFSFDLSRRGT